MSRTRIGRATRREVHNVWGPLCLACNGIIIDLHHGIPEYANGPTTAANLFPLCTNKLGKTSCHYRVHNYYTWRESEDIARGIKPDYTKYFWDWLDLQWSSRKATIQDSVSVAMPGTVTPGQTVRMLVRS